MELRNLVAFVELSRSGGFSAAAKVLATTQSTVSKAILQLEHDCGVQLVERLGRGIRPGLWDSFRHPSRLRGFDHKLCARVPCHCQAYESSQNQMSHGTIPKNLCNPLLKSCERGCGTPTAQRISLLLGLPGRTDPSAGAGACAASTGSQREAFKSLRPLTGEDDFWR